MVARSRPVRPTTARVPPTPDGKAVERKARRRSRCATSRTFRVNQRRQSVPAPAAAGACHRPAPCATTSNAAVRNASALECKRNCGTVY